jgi:dipeptidyl aminopeptidase/acylaminoacyl peptidase
VISIAGLSDIKTMVLNEDTFGFYTGHIVDVDDENAVNQLAEVSAINYIDQIKAPILLIHGSKDTRVDREQSEDFYDEAKRKIDVKYVKIKNGNHFFDDNESQQTLYREMTSFFEANLKP